MPTPDPRTEAIWALVIQGQFEDAVTQAVELEKQDPSLGCEVRRIKATSLFQLERYDEAYELNKSLADAEAGTDDWFSLLTSATMARQWDDADKAYERTLELTDDEQDFMALTPPRVMYVYARALADAGNASKALSVLSELGEIYARVRVTDDHFLHTRGVPFLGEMLEAAELVLRALGDRFDAGGWLDRFAAPLDEDGKAAVANLKSRLVR